MEAYKESPMSRITKAITILWAEVRCNAFLMYNGLINLKFYCELRGWDDSGKLVFIGCVEGPLFDKQWRFNSNLKIIKVFYNEGKREGAA